MSIDDAATMRLQTNIWRYEGRLVDFVFNLQVLGSSAWESAEYIDCCHGHCHHHPQNGTEPQTILSLNTVDDVERAYRVAESLIYDRLRIIRGQGE